MTPLFPQHFVTSTKWPPFLSRGLSTESPLIWDRGRHIPVIFQVSAPPPGLFWPNPSHTNIFWSPFFGPKKIPIPLICPTGHQSIYDYEHSLSGAVSQIITTNCPTSTLIMTPCIKYLILFSQAATACVTHFLFIILRAVSQLFDVEKIYAATEIWNMHSSRAGIRTGPLRSKTQTITSGYIPINN